MALWHPKTDQWNLDTGEYTPRFDRTSTSRVLSAAPHYLATFDTFADHEQIAGAYRWVIPNMSIRVTRWEPHPATNWRGEDFYIDIVQVEREGQIWRVTDLFLDLLVYEGKCLEVIDINELFDVVRNGGISPDLAEHATQSCFKLVERLSATQYSVSALLQDLRAPEY